MQTKLTTSWSGDLPSRQKEFRLRSNRGLVGGIPVQLGKTTVITSACVPVTNARYFSTELSVQVSRRFCPPAV